MSVDLRHFRYGPRPHCLMLVDFRADQPIPSKPGWRLVGLVPDADGWALAVFDPERSEDTDGY